MMKLLQSAVFGAICLCMATNLASSQTFSDAFAGFGSNDKQPIEIEAGELQVEDKTNSATFTGDVLVSQGETQLKTQKLRVFYDGSASGSAQQKISRLEASGRVFISAKDQTATGDEASFDMKREVMVMTGKKVVLSQGPNEVVGNRLTVNLKTGKADLQADNRSAKPGRVKVRIQPNSLNGN
jgi:lipopolysaccharide export system protein LptA